MKPRIYLFTILAAVVIGLSTHDLEIIDETKVFIIFNKELVVTLQMFVVAIASTTLMVVFCIAGIENFFSLFNRKDKKKIVDTERS
jgi:hypothetical protein